MLRTDSLQPYEQKLYYSCGPATMRLAMLKLRGRDYSEDYLLGELKTTKEGTDWQDMIAFPAKLGHQIDFKANSSWEELQAVFRQGSAIVGIEVDDSEGLPPGGHYALVYDMIDDMIELADPAYAAADWPHIMSRKDFMGAWRDEEFSRAFLLIK